MGLWSGLFKEEGGFSFSAVRTHLVNQQAQRASMDTLASLLADRAASSHDDALSALKSLPVSCEPLLNSPEGWRELQLMVLFPGIAPAPVPIH